MSIYEEAVRPAGRTLAEGVRRFQKGVVCEVPECAYTLDGLSVGDFEGSS
ncbi:hypothetical protein KACC15558_35030 [Brevibacterium ammoniilyticum]|uniref:Uncharacterized protein n=1 Tax=Brevibacterium ammoniilyticum TaxID=1046555 RepID=A0ABP9U634_9MICO